MKSSIEKAREICKNNKIQLDKKARSLGIDPNLYIRVCLNRYGRSPFNQIIVDKR